MVENTNGLLATCAKQYTTLHIVLLMHYTPTYKLHTIATGDIRLQGSVIITQVLWLA